MIYWQNYGGKEGMSTVKKIKVFFDSSVLIAGIASRGGASNRLLILCEKGFITPVISEKVVTEVTRNIEKNYPGAFPITTSYLKPFLLNLQTLHRNLLHRHKK